MYANEEMIAGYAVPGASYPDATLFEYRLC